MTTNAELSRHAKSLATSLPVANFLSYFAIAAVEFSVPFVAVSSLGANSLVVAVLGVCRFAPQVLLARHAARIVERYDLRTVMLSSELLRVGAFVLSALALAVSSGIGLGIFALANIALACASILTSVATQALVPAVFADEKLPSIYARLGVAESTADAAAPFLTGLGLAAIGVSPTFSLAAALALGACGLLLQIPRLYATADTVGGERESAPPSTLRRGLGLNLRTPPLRIITTWAVSYNFGQCIIEALLLIALIDRTPVTAASYGVIRTCAVLFAAVGSWTAERLPTSLRSGLGTAVFGCGAVASYALLGVGVYLGGMQGLVIVLVGFVLDEFCSGVVLVRIQAFRARAITQKDRPIATAAYRAVNLTAVPAGFAVGGVAGLLLNPASAILAVGLLMILPAALILSRSVREST
ncbi:MFS transporter [Streptomyces boncukensis]|uniref:MFS transporter n=1 Tax=Streptomyces boncukensis TaxID=2711219 RepID=A0A6G4X308_9ACTN|nr:MFS transporter [Streptomyces boncukensis]NGO71270.1 MFS transporter [Streptomyces boncukensis]